MQNDLRNLIELIKTGSRKEVKEAQQQIEKIWHGFFFPLPKKEKGALKIFLKELKTFDEIKEADHQAYFIHTLKWPLLALGEECFEKWAEFFLKCIQHPSGKIRQAVINVMDYLIIDITLVMRNGDVNDKSLNAELNKKIEKNKMRFGFFVLAVEKLLEKYYEPRFNRYKYVSSMPVGVYKSLQKLITEKLLRSEYFKDLYNEFLKKIEHDEILSDSDIRSLRRQIAKKRHKIEKELSEILKKNKSNLSLKDVKEIIYNENGQGSMSEILVTISKEQKSLELQDILNLITDAWNYFPHKQLKGLSPAEKILERKH